MYIHLHGMTLPIPDIRVETPDRAKKSLGQNFLVDSRVRSKILSAANLSTADLVVEIGPGRGFLTRSLVQQAGKVVAVELDEKLAQRLSNSYSNQPNLEVVTNDARNVDVDALVNRSTYKVVANLPYYAAIPILRRFLEADHRPSLMVVMLQREVANVVVAARGKMGMLSVAVQVYGKPRMVCTVPPRAFKPSPKVRSAVIRIDVYPSPAVELGSHLEFFRLVRAGFSAPRKQLRNSLSMGMDLSPSEADFILLASDIDSKRRAQTVTLGEWARLYQTLLERT